MKKDSDADSRAAKRHAAVLVLSLLLSLGPLIGAIWSMIWFMIQRHEMRLIHLAGKPITEVPALEPLPILIGFVLFPIGVFLLVRSTLWFSLHVREHRAKRSV